MDLNSANKRLEAIARKTGQMHRSRTSAKKRLIERLATIAARSPELIGGSTISDIHTWLSEKLGRQL